MCWNKKPENSSFTLKRVIIFSIHRRDRLIRLNNDVQIISMCKFKGRKRAHVPSIAFHFSFLLPNFDLYSRLHSTKKEIIVINRCKHEHEYAYELRYRSMQIKCATTKTCNLIVFLKEKKRAITSIVLRFHSVDFGDFYYLASAFQFSIWPKSNMKLYDSPKILK